MFMSNKNIAMSNKIVKGRYSFTKEEQNFIYTLVSKIHKDDDEFLIYKIDFNEQSELYQTTKNRKRFCDFAESLITKPIRILDANKTVVCSWLSYISHTRGNSYIECSFDPHLKPYLLQLKSEFVQAKLPTLLSFKSKYSSRLFLLLKADYDKQKKFKSNLFVMYDISDLIKQFEMPKSYNQRYSLFKNDFLNKALDEINEKTDFDISFKELKTGRKITSIEFCITEKEKSEEEFHRELLETKTRDDYIPTGFNSKAIDVLLDDELDLTVNDIKHIFDHYKAEDIEQVCLELWNSWSSKTIMSKQSYFRGKLKQLNRKKTENHIFGFDEI